MFRAPDFPSFPPVVQRKGDTDPAATPADAWGRPRHGHRLSACCRKLNIWQKTESFPLKKALSVSPESLLKGKYVSGELLILCTGKRPDFLLRGSAGEETVSQPGRLCSCRVSKDPGVGVAGVLVRWESPLSFTSLPSFPSSLPLPSCPAPCGAAPESSLGMESSLAEFP